MTEQRVLEALELAEERLSVIEKNSRELIRVTADNNDKLGRIEELLGSLAKELNQFRDHVLEDAGRRSDRIRDIDKRLEDVETEALARIGRPNGAPAE